MGVLVKLYVAILCYGYVSCAQELLLNPGFESGITHWNHNGFTMQTDSSHVHGGVVSVKCTGRTRTNHGPAQYIHITPGGRYSFGAYIKLIFDIQGHRFQRATFKIAFTWKDDGSKTYFHVTTRPYITSDDGWVHLGADFVAPNREYSQAKLYLEGLLPGVEYYLDDASLQEISENTNWENEANQRIETLRKNNVHFKFNVGNNFDVKDLQVQIDHRRHLFGFGSMVRSDNMVDPDFQQYQNIVYHMFNWATIQDYKWRYNRGNRTHPDYTAAVAATDALLNHSLQVRGHCMFWAVPGHEPDYVRSLSATEMKSEVDSHITYMTNITKGKLSHWDINNELLHGRYFETGTGDPNFSKHMFRQVHSADPKPNLFLNDYSVVANGMYTFAYLEQILQFKAANVGLGGVGVQSHFKEFTEPDPTMLKYRLDMIAQAGVPIWITELDLYAHDEKTRADWYEKALRMYFSHPGVEGIIIWGFWDHDISPLKALVHGYTYTLDEAGQRFLHLTKEEWSTHINKSLADGTEFDMRGYQGLYDLTVWYRGKPIKYTTFTLDKADKTLTIEIDGDGDEVQLPPQTDPFASVDIDHETTSQRLRTLGRATSQSQSGQLTCTTRWSQVSAVGNGKFVDVQCQSDEILTGCSSILKNNDYHRDGEQIFFSNGKPTCRAADGFRSTIGIQAVARCCSLKNLQCTYKTAGPSGTGVDDQVEVPCPNSDYPLGCATWTFRTESDGSFFTNTSCIGQNDDPKSGVYSYAACCHGNQVKCQTVYSAQPSGQNPGDKAMVQCPAGQVMTGCNVYAKYGRAAGAYISETNGVDQCFGVNGFPRYGDEIGVQAIATCCHL